MIARLPDWEQRLAAEIDAARNRAFQWGEHDCCMWVANVVLAMTGTDLALKWRGRYSDEAGAMAFAAEFGRWPWIIDRAVCEERINRIPVSSAARGDIVLSRHNNQLQPAICIGDHLAAVGLSGLIFLPRSAGVGAWGV